MLHKDILYEIFKKLHTQGLIKASLSCVKTHHVFNKIKKYFEFKIDNNLTNNGLKYIYGCTIIDFTWAQKITQKGLVKLLRSSKVRNLNLSFTNILDKEFDKGVLNEIFRNINIIDLSGTAIRDHELKYLKNIKNINLNDTGISDKGLKLLKKASPYLEQVNISNIYITDVGLKILLDNSNITTLNISNNNNITILCLEFIAKSNVKHIELRRLNINYSYFESEYFHQILNKIQTIDLSYNYNIYDDCFNSEIFRKTYDNIQTMSLSGTCLETQMYHGDVPNFWIFKELNPNILLDI
jgi:hypothetical protein